MQDRHDLVHVRAKERREQELVRRRQGVKA